MRGGGGVRQEGEGERKDEFGAEPISVEKVDWNFDKRLALWESIKIVWNRLKSIKVD